MEGSTKTRIDEMITKLRSETKQMLLSANTSGTSMGIDLQENFIRREKRKRMETRKEIIKMRAQLPEYDLNDIRM